MIISYIHYPEPKRDNMHKTVKLFFFFGRGHREWMYAALQVSIFRVTFPWHVDPSRVAHRLAAPLLEGSALVWGGWSAFAPCRRRRGRIPLTPTELACVLGDPGICLEAAAMNSSLACAKQHFSRYLKRRSGCLIVLACYFRCARQGARHHT